MGFKTSSWFEAKGSGYWLLIQSLKKQLMTNQEVMSLLKRYGIKESNATAVYKVQVGFA